MIIFKVFFTIGLLMLACKGMVSMSYGFNGGLEGEHHDIGDVGVGIGMFAIAMFLGLILWM